MELIEYNITPKDSLKNPYFGGSAEFTRINNRNKEIPYYKVWLFIEGLDLPFIKRVTYVLPKSFKNNRITVVQTIDNRKCVTPIWTWALFSIKIEIEDIGGRTFQINHQLTYGDEIINIDASNWKKIHFK